MVRAVLFDLDDTLFDRGAALASWAQAVAAAQLGRSLEDCEVSAIAAIDERGYASRQHVAAELAARYGLVVDAERFPADLAEHVFAEAGVRETIAWLARSCRVAVVTNGGAAQRQKLARLGIDDSVQAVFVSSELGVGKPERAFFERALQWTGCALCDVLVVGDQPVLDIVPAAQLGMRTAWRVRGAWPDGLPPPDHRIDRIAEVATIVARRTASGARLSTSFAQLSTSVVQSSTSVVQSSTSVAQSSTSVAQSSTSVVQSSTSVPQGGGATAAVERVS